MRGHNRRSQVAALLARRIKLVNSYRGVPGTYEFVLHVSV